MWKKPIYAVRVWRYILWSGDKEFIAHALPSVRLALEWIYRTEGYGNLINNISGTQSYDAWKMPGVGAYVNIQWIYALFAYGQMCRAIGETPQLCGRNTDEFLADAIREYNAELWDDDEGYWHAYKPNEQSHRYEFGSAVFSDQLFGHWATSLDPDSRKVLDAEMERRALQKIYLHNRITEPTYGYSCWSNGMMPNREETVHIADKTDMPEYDGYHALCCWVSTEMNLASMLGYFGMEQEALDVFENMSRGMGRNVLAVGEYNRSVDANVQAVVLPWESGKDTPRFPPYPCYKSSWEFLVSMLGMTMDLNTIYFKPFGCIHVELHSVMLAGTMLTVRVEPGWIRCLVNGVVGEPKLQRGCKSAVLEFVRTTEI